MFETRSLLKLFNTDFICALLSFYAYKNTWIDLETLQNLWREVDLEDQNMTSKFQRIIFFIDMI